MPNFTECQSIMTALNFAKANHGASVFSRHVSESYVREGMRLIEITPTIWTWTAIVTRKEMLRHPLVHEFRNFFLECEARFAESAGLRFDGFILLNMDMFRFLNNIHIDLLMRSMSL